MDGRRGDARRLVAAIRDEEVAALVANASEAAATTPGATPGADDAANGLPSDLNVDDP